MNIVQMNAMMVAQEGNLYRILLPNWAPIAELLVPLDDRSNIDFNLLCGITDFLTKQQGLSAPNLKQLRKLQIPENIIIWRGAAEYRIYLGKDILSGMQIAYLQLPNDIITGQIVIAIAIMMQKRWSGFIQQQTIVSQLQHSHLQSR